MKVSGKMICILSQAFREHSTEQVMQWLDRWDVPYCRLNASDVEQAKNGSSLTLRDGTFDFEWDCNGRRMRASEVTVAWFRRWLNKDTFDYIPPDVFGDSRWRVFNTLQHNGLVQREMRNVNQAVFAAFKNATWLNKPHKCVLNKLLVLAEAQRCGLDVPATLVSSDPDRILEFAKHHGEVITKCTSDMNAFRLGEESFVAATSLVDQKRLAREWKGGFPTFIQERLKRAYELRIFYLDGECSTAAYMYQPASDHIADGRMGGGRPTRFSLPENLVAALRRLMTRLDLDIACIDMVRIRDGRWVFLEVNPNGQYAVDGMLCNEKFDKRIAHALVRRANESIRRTARAS